MSIVECGGCGRRFCGRVVLRKGSGSRMPWFAGEAFVVFLCMEDVQNAAFSYSAMYEGRRRLFFLLLS